MVMILIRNIIYSKTVLICLLQIEEKIERKIDLEQDHIHNRRVMKDAAKY